MSTNPLRSRPTQARKTARTSRKEHLEDKELSTHSAAVSLWEKQFVDRTCGGGGRADSAGFPLRAKTVHSPGGLTTLLETDQTL